MTISIIESVGTLQSKPESGVDRVARSARLAIVSLEKARAPYSKEEMTMMHIDDERGAPPGIFYKPYFEGPFTKFAYPNNLSLSLLEGKIDAGQATPEEIEIHKNIILLSGYEQGGARTWDRASKTPKAAYKPYYDNLENLGIAYEATRSLLVYNMHEIVSKTSF